MSGLVLKLAPKERVLINGAIVENGDRRSRLSIVTPNAHILRLKDAIPEDEANTPVRRTCLIAQKILAGDTPLDTGATQLTRSIEQLAQVMMAPDCVEALEAAQTAAAMGQVYQSLKALRRLLPIEEAMLTPKSGD